MPMTIDQSIEFYAEQARMQWDATELAIDTGNYHLLALNLSGTLEDDLMVAMLQWRQGNVSPKSSIEKVCKRAIDGLELINTLEPERPIWKGFNYFPAGYCSLLLGKTLELPLAEAITGCQDDTGDYLSQCLDACLLNAIQLKELPETWDVLLTKFSGTSRYNLLFQTYQTYADIVRIGQIDTVDLVDLVEKAAMLYLDRRKDDYFSGGLSSLGGGPDNSNVVDYRLSALIACCTALEMDDLSEGAKVHYWRW